MFRRLYILALFFVILGFFAFVLVPHFFKASLASTNLFYIFLESMEVETSNIGLIGVITPEENFASDGNIQITFLGSSLGDWCKTDNLSLAITGIENSEAGSIEAALPGVALTAICHQNANGDYISIGGVGALTGGTSYGFEISSNVNFSTGPKVGRNDISVKISSGGLEETKFFPIYLISNSTVSVIAQVSDADSVVCTISTNVVSMGVLYKGGAYVTASHKLGTSTTSGSRGYYWTVFGLGDGSTGAGLFTPGYLIQSLGSTVNLLQGEGFGLVVNPPVGANVPEAYQLSSLGVFGSVKMGFDDAQMILYRTSEQAFHEEATVTYGARASTGSATGSYQETLTYSCGGYIGGYRPLELIVDPEILNFGEEEEVKTFSVSNSGTGTLEWVISEPEYTSVAGWITNIEPMAGKTSTSTDNVEVRVDRSSLPSGNYSAIIPVNATGSAPKSVLVNLGRTLGLPTIVTLAPYDVFTDSAKAGGEITSDGGGTIISKGLCYGIATLPTYCVEELTGETIFYSTMSPLSLGTLYYVRAYAENSLGLTYGNEHIFITQSTFTVTPENRDWDNTDAEVSIEVAGDAIAGIYHCWTTETSCFPDVYEGVNPSLVSQGATGIWNLCYRYQDDFGEKSNIECSGTYKVDKVSPLVNATNSSETWYNSQRTAVVNVVDLHSGVNEVRYNWGTNLMNEACTEGGTVTSHSAELNAPAGGTILYLCARDNAGNQNTWNGLYNWSGDEPNVGDPEIYSGSHHNQTHFKGTVSVRSSVSDAGGSGLNTASCQVSFNGAEYRSIGVTYSSGYCQYANYTPNANFSIRFRISDNASPTPNTGTSQLKEFTYDATAPTTSATLTSPPGGSSYTCDTWTSSNVRSVLSCEDNSGGSGCKTGYPKYCTDTNNSCTPATTYSSAIEISTAGASYLRYQSYDNLDNIETVNSCTVKITKELEGYAWSGDFGWISFSCENLEGCYDSDYKVSLQGSDFMGYAWSESYGWISFNCANDDSCATSNYKVTLNSGSLSGYAWSGDFGWINFNSVTYNSGTREFSGSAFGLGGDDEISMNCADKNICATSDYKVKLKN